MNTAIAKTVECIVYAVVLILLIIGKADGLATSLPLPQYLSQVPALLLLGIAIITGYRTGNPQTASRFALAVALAALGAIMSTTRPGDAGIAQFGFLPGHMMFFAAMLLGAAGGITRIWIGAWTILTIGDIGHRVFGILQRMDMLSLHNPAEFLINEILAVSPLLTYLFLAGLLVQLIVRTRLPDILPLSTLPVIPEKSELKPAPVRGIETGVFQASSIDKTTAFTVEYIASLKQTGEGEFADLLSSVVYFMSHNFRAYSALAFIYDPGTQTFILNSFHSRSMTIINRVVIALGRGVIGTIGTEKHSFMSGDITLYNQELLYYSSQEMINSVLAVPIISDQHELLGVLLLDSKDKNAFNDQHKDTLKRFSGLAAALIINHRMKHYQERTARQFQTFYQSSQQFTTAVKVDDVFNILMQMASQITYTTRAMIITFDAARRCGTILRMMGGTAEIQPGFEFPINEGLYGYAFQKRTLINIPDMRAHQGRYFRFIPGEPFNPAIGSIIILPIIDDEQRCMGLLSLESDREYQFGSELEPVLSTLVGNACVALNRALLYHKMEMLATTDGLTGLPNHRTFQEQLAIELERSRRYGQPVSLALMDIDHFKSFNDTYGHTVGDLVLKEVANCIKRSIRRTDFPARYGGEEFIVIMPATDGQTAIITAERIRQNIMNHVVQSMDRQLRVTVSIGYDTFTAGQELTQAQIINNADTAMYHSKEHGRNQVTRWENGMVGKG